MKKINNSCAPKRETIPVFFSVDDRYAPCLAVAIRSLIENASKDFDYAIYILVDKLSLVHRTRLARMGGKNVRIKFVNVTKNLAELGEKLHLRDYYTATTYYRFFIPELFPEYDKGIYLDCDVAVLGDVSEMYSVDLGDNFVGAVSDDVIASTGLFVDYAEKCIDVPHETYFNAGVLLMNLKALRECDVKKAIINLMNWKTFPVAQDQDYLNILFHEKVTYLPRGWNVAPFPNLVHDYPLGIIHYKLNMKPWHYKGVRFEEYFWNYAAKTSYLGDLQETLEGFTEADAEEDEKHSEHLVALVKSELADAMTDFTSPLKFMMKKEKN